MIRSTNSKTIIGKSRISSHRSSILIRITSRVEIPVALIKSNSMSEDLNQRSIRRLANRVAKFRADFINTRDFDLGSFDLSRERSVGLEELDDGFCYHGLVGWEAGGKVELSIHSGCCYRNDTLNTSCMTACAANNSGIFKARKEVARSSTDSCKACAQSKERQHSEMSVSLNEERLKLLKKVQEEDGVFLYEFQHNNFSSSPENGYSNQ